MVFLNNFDATKVAPQTAPQPVPAGDYLVRIIQSEQKSTQAGSGKFLELTLEIIDGQHRGRKLWARLNLLNQNQQAVEIARGQLSAICHAVGVLKPRDSVDLHNIPLVAKVICKKRSDTGELANEVKGFGPRKSSAAASNNSASANSQIQNAAPVNNQPQTQTQNPAENVQQNVNPNAAPWDR